MKRVREIARLEVSKDVPTITAKDAELLDLVVDMTADIYDGTLMAMYMLLENYELFDADLRLQAVKDVRRIIKNAAGMD